MSCLCNFQRLSIFLLFLTLPACASANGQESPCEIGLHFAKAGNYFRAHYEWRFIADDASQKMWGRTTAVCLKAGGIAKSNSEIIEWLKRAGESGSSDGWIQAAILTINEVGICNGYSNANIFLDHAAKENNESALFFVKQIAEIHAESCIEISK